MKKLLFTLSLVLMSMGVFAQTKTFEVGGKLNYATDAPHFGIGAVARYNFDEHFRPELTMNFYPKDGNDVSAWDINANLHYLFHMTDRFKLYPLGGVGIMGASYDGPAGSTSSTKLGANLGGGLQFNLTDKLHLNAETYYQFVSDDGRGVMSVSLVYVL